MSTNAFERIEDPAELIETIAAALARPAHFYREVVPADAPDVEDRIALLRSCGRKAGHRVGLTVETAATDADGTLRLGSLVLATGRADGAREVHVVATGQRTVVARPSPDRRLTARQVASFGSHPSDAVASSRTSGNSPAGGAT